VFEPGAKSGRVPQRAADEMHARRAHTRADDEL
jgi:hypothetical protein